MKEDEVATAQEQSEASPQQRKGKITDMLSAPRRKRKYYVVLALGESFDKDLAGELQNFIRAAYPALSVAMPTSTMELKRQFGRNISLLVIDDEFSAMPDVLATVEMAKVRKQSEIMPVLFLTRRADDLVKAYHEKLLPYHEVDEFVSYQNVPSSQVLSCVKTGLDNKNRRRSRRYTISMPLTFFHLGRNEVLPGQLLDLSVHGGLLRAQEGIIFRQGDQLRLNIPVTPILPPTSGDFLKISAKVRRVYISGDTAGLSFEYVSEPQAYQLAKYVTTVVTNKMALKAQATVAPAKKR